MTQCAHRVQRPKLPEGWTADAIAAHPLWSYWALRPMARCELDDGHEPPHRSGNLLWHDPPILMVGGRAVG